MPALLAQLPPGFVGEVDRPDPAVVQSGVVLVRGWAYDPIQISRIELFVDDEFQHNAVIRLPYIDVNQAYPQWPGIFHTNPGFQASFLASRFSNGPHTVSLRVYMNDGRIEEVGRRTIIIDNTINQPPFGAVDQPGAVGIFNGTGVFPVVGWVTDSDGVARVDVQIDGGDMQSAMYGDPRPDVAAMFGGDFPAALFSGFIANVDTTRVTDGMHVLTVTATDRHGLERLIGRRTIQVFNSETMLKPFGYLDTPLRDAVLTGTQCDGAGVPLVSPFVRPTQHITQVRGWALDLGTRLDTGRVSYVELLVDGVRWASTDDCGLLGGFSNCYGLPRYDVQRFYPFYPDAPRSGFMFTLDVGALLGLGVRPGHHVLKVRVGDQQQTFSEIPGPAGIPVFFDCAETNQDLPAVGHIDIPTTFDFITGDTVFQGWALDFNGVAAIELIIDGNYVGQAQYGFPRADVQQQYPTFPTASTSGWRFTMNTRFLSNARHRLTVRVLDGRGNRNEIGSVDFYVMNPTNTP
ncbi:MAG TPA: hypothetical protein VM779_06860 [Thermoanaerobaculia bacterium]|nr:hypothetical protein [Thermoanaerobaculia bacterium]